MTPNPPTAVSTSGAGESESPIALGLRDLLLTLADNKRLLGIRYSDRMLGSPSLETGIAAASMAQDEWGHSRLTYALLGDLGDDPAALEHQRPPEAYYSMEALDRPFDDFTEFIAAALLIDGALTEQYRALARSRYEPIRNRVEKLLEEEAVHTRFAEAWAEKLCAGRTRDDFSRAAARQLKQALLWLGPADDPAVADLVRESYLDAGHDELRRRLLSRVAPVLERCGLTNEVALARDAEGGEWRPADALDWSMWDGRRRRLSEGGPDAETLARVRGDRNRTLLVDT